MTDEDSKNKRPDLPNLDINIKGMVEATVYRLDSGFILCDQTKDTRHSLTSTEDISDTLKNAYKSVTSKVLKLLSEIETGQFVDLTIIVETRAPDLAPPEIEFTEPLNLNITQLAMMISDIVNGGYGSGVMGSPMFGRNVAITPSTIGNYMNSA